MSLEATIKTGATAVAATGGDDQLLVSLGASEGKHVVYYNGDTDLRSRRTIEFTVKEPKVQSNAPNGYTQARMVALMRLPLELDNGALTVNTVRIELAVDPETTSAEVEEYVESAAQILAQSDFTAFWSQQSLT